MIMSATSARRGFVLVTLTLLGVVCAAGCGQSTKRIDPDSDDALMGGISSKDFRSVCVEMSQSLVQIKAIQQADKAPRIAFAQVKNNSDEVLDTQGFLEKMRTQLLTNSEGKVEFLDRELVKQILDEKDLKLSGTMSGSPGGAMHGADYFLAGTITGIRRARGRESTSYMRLAFRLTDANSSAVVWEHDYEMKFYQKSGIYDR